MWDSVSKTQLKNFQWYENQLKKENKQPERTLAKCLFELTALNDSLPSKERIPVWREGGEFLSQYEFGDRSRAYFHSNGKKRSGTKASLAPAIAGNRPATLELNAGTATARKKTAVAFDFMAYVQISTAKVDATLHSLLEDLLLIGMKRALRDCVSQHADTAYIVCDPYPEEGVPKDCESDARAAAGVIMFDKIFGTGERHPTPMLPPLLRRKFLRLAHNKRRLLALLEGVIKRLLHTGKYPEVATVFLTGAGKTMSASRLDRRIVPAAGQGSPPDVTVSTSAVPWLESTCPEADQTLLVAVRHWVSEMGGNEMIVASWDTDVFVSMIALANQLVGGDKRQCKLAVLRGVGARRQRADVWAARERLAGLPDVGGKANAKLLLDALVAFHNVGGSDANPFPWMMGKKKQFAAWIKMLNIPGGKEQLKAMGRLGIDEEMSNLTRQSFTTLYLHMYGMFGKAKDLDHARGLLWMSLKCDEARFPPTERSLDLQVARTSTQCRITYMAVNDFKAELPEPDGYNKVVDGNGKVKWEIKEREQGTYYAPLVLLQMKPCNCNSARQKTPHYCRAAKCSCFQREIPCTDRCDCCKGANVCHNKAGQGLSALGAAAQDAASAALATASTRASSSEDDGGVAGSASAEEEDNMSTIDMELEANRASNTLTTVPDEEGDAQDDAYVGNVLAIHERKYVNIVCDDTTCACWAPVRVGGGRRRRKPKKAHHYLVEWEGHHEQKTWTYEPVRHINRCSHWRAMLDTYFKTKKVPQVNAEMIFVEDAPSDDEEDVSSHDEDDEEVLSDTDDAEEDDDVSNNESSDEE